MVAMLEAISVDEDVSFHDDADGNIDLVDGD